MEHKNYGILTALLRTMMGRTFSAFQHGIYGEIAHIEAATQPALRKIEVTGLPAEVVKESRARIRVAVSRLGFDVPSGLVLIHLSPANARKEGSQFDLPMAMALLTAEQCLPNVDIGRFGFLGELGLSGEIKKVRNIIPLLLALKKMPQVEKIFLPVANAPEAALLGPERLVLVRSLGEVVELLLGRREPESVDLPRVLLRTDEGNGLDEVIGQRMAKRALEIALAGRHHLLFVGSPGIGKSMLANVAASLLPPLEEGELVELAMIHNAASEEWEPKAQRPFRSPHHGISAQGFVGGGTGRIIPGELSLAHRGVLFLDELPEFRRDALEGLREPLQSGEIHLHRLGHSFVLPARFTLIAAMNPCPCGYSLSKGRRCFCPREKIQNYRKRISGPLLDRIDLGVVMSQSELGGTKESGEHLRVRRSIQNVWRKQWDRFGEMTWNGDGAVNENEGPFALESSSRNLLKKFSAERAASMRSQHKLVRVARTIADLADESTIQPHHLEEAWTLRCPDVPSLNA